MRNECCRGCLTEPTSHIDLAWSGYVDAVDKLIVAVDGEHDQLGLNLRGTVQKLDGHISIAIMHAMEAGPQVEEKVSATESPYTGWPDPLARYSAVRFEAFALCDLNVNIKNFRQNKSIDKSILVIWKTLRVQEFLPIIIVCAA